MTPWKTALVVTGDSDDDLALTTCQMLGERGLRVVVAGLEDTGSLMRWSRYCQGIVPVARGRADMEEAGPVVLEALKKAARESKADFLFPADVSGALAAGRLAEALPNLARFPFPTRETLTLLDNKWNFYRFLDQHGVATPKTWLLENAAQARALDLPLVLKPLSLGAGRGVYVVRTAAERDAKIDGSDPYLKWPILAQEVVEGEDVDVSILARDGILNAWAVQIRRPNRVIDYIDDARPVELARRIAQACSFTGLAHFDMRYDGPLRSAVKVIECNPRVWASLPQTFGLGADFIGRGLAMAEGRTPEVPAQAFTGVCADLRDVVRGLWKGRSRSVCENALLRFALRDPLPILYRGLGFDRARRAATFR